MSVPTVRPGVLSLGDLFNATWRTYTAQFWLFVGLAAVPQILVAALMSLVVLGGFAVMRDMVFGSGAISLLIGMGILAILLGFVLSLFTFRCNAMTALAVRDLSAGLTPGWPDLLARTRGIMGRLALFMVAFFALIFVSAGIVTGLEFLLLWPQPSTDSTTTVLGVVVLVLFGVAFYVAVVVAEIRFIYFLPDMAIEQSTALGALRRSWSLTRGVFWRTVGYALLISLAVGVPVYVISFLGQALISPGMMLLAGGSLSGASSSGAMLAGGGVLLVLGLVVTYSAIILSTPITGIYVALMYISRVREVAGEPPSSAFYRPGALPGYPTPGAAPAYPTPTAPPGPPSPSGYPAPSQPGYPTGPVSGVAPPSTYPATTHPAPTYPTPAYPAPGSPPPTPPPSGSVSPPSVGAPPPSPADPHGDPTMPANPTEAPENQRSPWARPDGGSPSAS